MKNKLKSHLGNPVISKGQQRLLSTSLKVAGFFYRGGVVLVIFMLLVLFGHFTGFEQSIRILTGVEQ